VKAVWLSKNFGQHAATLAGMAVTTSEWIITIDEDGQQNPNDFGKLLDTAVANDASLVYAKPTNRPPHGVIRNTFSWMVKNTIFRMLTDGSHRNFNSFRLVSGAVGRTLAAYVGEGVYLDVALTWIVQNVAQCPVELRQETRRESGYSYRRLSSHFWRLVLSSGTRPLRIVGFIGIGSFVAGVAAAAVIVFGKLNYGYAVSGWASVFVALLLMGGLILLVLGVLAEYLGMLVRASIGKPLYVAVSDPDLAALRRDTNLPQIG
jgi:glycosyltransferase involved in cell wall biosynthesis